MAESGTSLERTIIEGSALFVTLLFIITREPAAMAWLGFVGLFFILAAMAAVLVIWARPEDRVARVLRTFEVMIFFLALFLLAIWMYVGAGTAYLVPIWFFVGYALFAGVVPVLLEWLRSSRERRRQSRADRMPTLCPRCGNKTQYIAQSQRMYCPNCQLSFD